MHHTSSQHIECLFSIVAEVEEGESNRWIEIKDLSHNHCLGKLAAHKILQQMARILKISNEISR